MQVRLTGRGGRGGGGDPSGRRGERGGRGRGGPGDGGRTFNSTSRNQQGRDGANSQRGPDGGQQQGGAGGRFAGGSIDTWTPAAVAAATVAQSGDGSAPSAPTDSGGAPGAPGAPGGAPGGQPPAVVAGGERKGRRSKHDPFDNAGNWGDDFPAAEDWDNEEYTGSLADSKVFTPSGQPRKPRGGMQQQQVRIRVISLRIMSEEETVYRLTGYRVDLVFFYVDTLLFIGYDRI